MSTSFPCFRENEITPTLIDIFIKSCKYFSGSWVENTTEEKEIRNYYIKTGGEISAFTFYSQYLKELSDSEVSTYYLN